MAKLILKVIVGIFVGGLWIHAACNAFQIQECISAGAKPAHCSESGVVL